MGQLRAGIIGTGMATGISMAHYTGYRHSGQAEVTAVYNEPASLAEQWCRENRISGVKICETLDEFFEQVDIVSICTPNFTHADYIKRCLDAGKHVMCEKPIGSGQRDLKELEEVCRSHSLVNMVNFNYRRIPGLRYLAELVSEGKLGDVILYRHTMGGGRLSNESVGYEWRMDREKSGCGSLGDFGCHILDTMFYILGCGPESVSNLQAVEKIQIKERLFQGRMKAVENDDCTVVQGTAGLGTLFSFMTSRVGALGNCLEVIGTKGIAKFNMERPFEVCIEFREPGNGFAGKEIRYQVEDPLFSEFLNSGTKTEMAACSYNTASFAAMSAQSDYPATPVSYGIQIEKLINEIDVLSLKIS